MPPDLDSFYRAAQAYARIRTAEPELALLKNQIQRLESTIASSRQTVVAFLEGHPGGQRMLDEHVAFLRRSGLLSDKPKRSEKRDPTRRSAPENGPHRPRTAAATEAAAAKRRAFREANPGARTERHLAHRLALFDDGFVRGYRDHVENPLARNRFAKGDRSRGWPVGAEAAAADISAGVIETGAIDFAIPPTPRQAREDFAARLRSAGVPDSEANREAADANLDAAQGETREALGQ